MSFITQQQAEQIIGFEFKDVDASNKARLVLLANAWMKNAIGFTPCTIPEELHQAACEIIRGIQAGVIYHGAERATKRERVKAEVEVEEEFFESSRAISSYEQVALAIIASLDLKNPCPPSFSFKVYRG